MLRMYPNLVISAKQKKGGSMNLNILRNLSYGVYVITTLDGSRPTGCIANSVMQVTSSPTTVALSMNHDNFTNECIKKTLKFAVTILSIESDPGLIGNFGFQSGKEIDKFKDIDYTMKEELPIITDSCGYMIFEVKDFIETATHTVFIGEMIDCDVLATKEEMTYAYYHKVVKGKSPKNAPTYIPDEIEQKEGYKCSVCNYVYDQEIAFEELPEDFTCPICKQLKKVFVKL